MWTIFKVFIEFVTILSLFDIFGFGVVKTDFSFKGFVQIQQNISHVNEHSHFPTKQPSPAAHTQPHCLQGAPPEGQTHSLSRSVSGPWHLSAVIVHFEPTLKTQEYIVSRERRHRLHSKCTQKISNHHELSSK